MSSSRQPLTLEISRYFRSSYDFGQTGALIVLTPLLTFGNLLSNPLPSRRTCYVILVFAIHRIGIFQQVSSEARRVGVRA